MIITKIEPFDKNCSRYAIYIDSEPAFVLYKGEIKQLKLNENCTLDEAAYQSILEEILIPRAKKRGMNLLMKSDRTEADVRGKLRSGGYPNEAIDAAIAYLISFKYIDDSRYAEEYIRFKSQSQSVRQIKLKLTEKGIDKALIEKAIANHETDNQNSECALIERLINKRCKGNISNQSYEEKQKLFAYLYNKGFRISDIEKVYNNLT